MVLKKSSKQENRRKLYVSGPIQGRLLKKFCIYWVIYHVLLGMFLVVNTLVSSSHPESVGQLLTTIWYEHHRLIALVTATFPIVFVGILRTTHRIAGPLIRFERALAEMAEGKRIEKIRLRQHDMLVEFQDAMNAFIEAHNRELDGKDSDVDVAECVQVLGEMR